MTLHRMLQERTKGNPLHSALLASVAQRRGIQIIRSVGLASGCEIAVMDHAANIVASGGTGEILLRGPGVILELC